MDLGNINWLAVVACVVVSMISGSLWHNPKTLYPAWWKAIGRSESDAPGMQNMGIVCHAKCAHDVSRMFPDRCARAVAQWDRHEAGSNL